MKVLNAFLYGGVTGEALISITIMDRKTGKVYSGRITKYQDSLKEWKERRNE